MRAVLLRREFLHPGPEAKAEARLRRAARRNWKSLSTSADAPVSPIPRLLFVLHDAHGGGWLLSLDDVPSAHQAILRIAMDGQEYQREAARACVGDLPDTATMTLEYAALYRGLFGATSAGRGVP